MHSDRELLELAARAAGLTGECHLLTGDCSDPNEPGGFRYEHPDGGHDWWNPLMDDGDALRLAVKLGIDIEWQHDSGYVKVYRTKLFGVWSGHVTELFCVGDAMAAARRAIVRAAATIGEAMK